MRSAQIEQIQWIRSFIDMRALPRNDDHLFKTAGLADVEWTNKPEALFFPNTSEIESTIIGGFEKTMKLSHYVRQCIRRFHFFLSMRVLARSEAACSDQKCCVQIDAFNSFVFESDFSLYHFLGEFHWVLICFQQYNIHRRYVDA